jgi:hypothetical protein
MIFLTKKKTKFEKKAINFEKKSDNFEKEVLTLNKTKPYFPKLITYIAETEAFRAKDKGKADSES